MSKKLLIYLLISVFINIFMKTNQANACDTWGTPVLNIHDIILARNGGSYTFSGYNSYDEDNGSPYDSSHGITNYYWYLYESSTENYYYVGEGVNFTLDPSLLSNGQYYIDLYVRDDEWHVPDPDPYGSDYDTCEIYVGEINFYTDLNKTNKLVDWYGYLGHPRSPRFIFAEDNTIFIEAQGFNSNSGYAEIISESIKVESSSGGLQRITLRETGNNTDVFNNSIPDDELFYLSYEDGYTPDGDKIKVVDEDILYFSLEIAPLSDIYQDINDIMVERAEYSACGLEVFESKVQEFRDEMEYIDWFQNGYEIFENDTGSDLSDPMSEFIRDAGDNSPLSLEADFLYIDCHGDDGGTGVLMDDNGWPESDIIMASTGILTTSDWNNDVDWIWITACNILEVAGGGRDHWDDALFGSPNPAHMMLSYYDNFTMNPDRVDDFFDHARNSETIINSFYHANSDGIGDKPAAVITHYSNVNDTLYEVTQDATTTTMRYFWYDQSANVWYFTSYHKQSENILNENEEEYELPVSVQPELSPVYVEVKPLKNASALKDFKHFKRNYGLDVFYKSFDAGSTYVQNSNTSSQIAKNTLEDVLGKVPEPNESDIYENVFYVTDFEWGQEVDLSAGIPLVRNIVYRHKYNGIPILGDTLSIHVSGDKVIKTKVCWQEIKSEETKEKKKVKNVKESLVVAKENLSRKLKKNKVDDYKLKDASLCYYGFHEAGKSIKKLVPAWRFVFENDKEGYCEYIDAHSNKPFDAEGDINNALKKDKNSK